MIQLLVRGPGRRERTVDAIVDTGFTGLVTLPSSMIDALHLPHIAQGRAALADGSEVLFDLYEATILWDGIWLTADAGSIDADALVGMALFVGYSLYLEAVAGGRVTIESLG